MGIKQTIVVVTAVLVLSRLLFGSTPTTISPAELETIITQHTGTTDFILIDVRDNSEVKDGIIATEYCKPYHMSWNSGKFDSSYQLLPKTLRIIVYCRSGNRSNQAATKLLSSGYPIVASMAGGTNSYNKEKLVDSAQFKQLSKLPEPSYLGTPVTISRNNPSYHTVIPAIGNRQQFTLQGRVVRSATGRQQQNAPIYILERIGDETNQKINGLHRLIQEKD